MEKRTKRIIAMILSMAFPISISSGCSFIKNVSGNDMNVPNVSSSDADSVSSEYDIVGIIESGFFYTSDNAGSGADESQYLELRKESTDLFSETIKDLADESFKVTSDLKKHEDILFEYMDLIDDDTNSAIQMITEGILSYRTAFLSYEEQINTYVAAESDDNLVRAYIERLTFETVCKLADSQIDYLSWLMGSTEVVIALLESSDADKVQELMAACEALYSKTINASFTQMLSKYYAAAEIYIYILSADYYAGEYYLDAIGSALVKMETDSNTEGIKKLYESILTMDRKPNVMIDTIPAKSLSESRSSDNFSIQFLSSVTQTINIAGHNKMMSTANELLRQLNGEAFPDIAGTMSHRMILKEIVLNTDKTNAIRDSFGAQLNQGSGGELRSRIAKSISTGNNDTETVKMTAQAESMKKAADPGIDRETVIDMIGSVQSGLNVDDDLGLKFLKINADIKYAMIIKAVNVLISRLQNIDKEKIQNMRNLINTDLKQILGANKDEFIKKITTTQAEQLLDTFDKWKSGTKNFDDFAFTRDDLIRLVGSLGIYVKLEPAATIPSPAAMVEHWEGDVSFNSTFLILTDGTSKQSEPENASGIFKFTVNRDGGKLSCTIESVLEMDLTGFEVTEFMYADNDIIIMFEREEPAGVKTIYYWEGLVHDDGKYMEGTCKLVVSVSDANVEEWEQNKDDSQLDIPMPKYIEMNGIFYVNKTE